MQVSTAEDKAEEIERLYVKEKDKNLYKKLSPPL